MIDFLEPMYRHWLLKTYGKTEREIRKGMIDEGKSKHDIDEYLGNLYKNFVAKSVKEGGI